MAAVVLEMLKKLVASSRLVLAMVTVQVIATGLQLLSRVILSNGTFIFVFMVYRFIVAALCLVPFALYFERDDHVRKLKKWSIWLWLFFNATALTTGLTLFNYGIRDTTATYATDFLNLIPIVTFILSIIFGIEKLGLDSRAGKAKTVGVVMCVGGVLIATLYKGVAFHFYMPHDSIHHPLATLNRVKTNWTRGTLLLIGCTLSYATFYILQAKVNKVFPLTYWTTLIICIIASVQSAVASLFADRRAVVWKLGWNLELLTIVYSGALATGAIYSLLLWATSKRGPSYPLMFNPLGLILVVVSEALMLGTAINLGAMLGMVLIILGLFFFVWGKNKEMKMKCLLPTNPVVDEEAQNVPKSIEAHLLVPQQRQQPTNLNIQSPYLL